MVALPEEITTATMVTDEEVVLPGYDVGVDESGVQHSRLKLQESASRLSKKLVEIEIDSSNDSDISIQTFYCHEEEETWTYRCRCNFQIVQTTDTTTTTTNSNGSSYRYRYAMRSKGRPVLLDTKNSFPKP